ncbi:hypothetical protein M9458_044122, partial [Cirrhinus mrigala]
TSHTSFDNKRDLQKNAALSVKTPGEDLFVKAVKTLWDCCEPCQDKGRMG